MKLLHVFLSAVAAAAALCSLVGAEIVGSLSEQRYPIRSRTNNIRDLSGDDDDDDEDEDEDTMDSNDGDPSGTIAVAGGSVPKDWTTPTNWADYDASQLDCNLYRTLTAASGQIQMKEVVDPLAEAVTFEMTYRGRAWLGIALASNGRMNGNVAVIGRPDESVSSSNPGKYSLNSKDVSGVRLLSSERQTLLNGFLEQNDTHTVMRFTQRLEEANERSIVTAPGTNTAIYAVGVGNSLGTHARDGVFQIMLTYCLKPGQDPSVMASSEIQNMNGTSNKKNYWIAHGVLMALVWGLFVPLAIGSSVLRRLFSDGVWFHLHRVFNGIAMSLMIVGFVLAMVEGNGSVFSEGGHQMLGAILFILSILQLISGVLRPSLHPLQQRKNEQPGETHVVAASSPVEGPNRLSIIYEKSQECSSREVDFNGSTSQKLKDEHTIQHDVADTMLEKPVPQDEPVSTSVEKSRIRCVWEIQHRLFGMAALGLAWVTAYKGIELLELYYDTGHGIEIFFWASSASIMSIVFAFKVCDVMNRVR